MKIRKKTHIDGAEMFFLLNTLVWSFIAINVQISIYLLLFGSTELNENQLVGHNRSQHLTNKQINRIILT